MFKKVLITIILLNLSQFLLAQSVANYDWVNNGFFIGRADYLNNVVLKVDSKGNLINGGSKAAVFDLLYLHKISSNGDLIWKTADRHQGKILDLIVDELDNIYVTGYYHVPFGEDTLFVKKIISVDNLPQTQWEYIFLIGGDGLNIRDRTFKLVKSNSSIVVTGIALNRKPLADIVTIKLDTNGVELWKKYYTNGENYSVYPKDLAIDKNGNIFVYGNSVTDDSSTAQLIKYSSTGDLLWNKTVINPDSPNISAVDIEISNGSPWISANSQGVTLLNKYDSLGNIIKEIRRETSGANLGLSIDESQNVYQICNDSIFKYNSAGSIISSTGLPSIANVTYSHFDVDEEQNIYILGKRSHFYTAKINQNLEVESAFETIWEDPPNAHHTSSTPFGIAASTTHGLFISGELKTYDSLNFNSSNGQVSVKYSQLPTEVKELKIKPADYFLSQNYPNPFNPSTNINYSIPKQSFVSIKVYNTIGEVVAELVNEEKSVGNYNANFNAVNFSSGVYFYRIIANGFVETKKMLLLR